ncbi:MAG: hypothetical protein HC799_16050 [Limnothrix sp. RL_2_0]|nr:hypothetical protein [Limnothrix sp. RL_2_0]
MQKQISKNIGLVFLLLSVSCANVKARDDARKSFRENRDEYDLVVTKFQQYRDSLDCAVEVETKCEFSTIDVGIEEALLDKLKVGTLSSDPLVIQFKPVDSIYAKIWYAETKESENYINALPYVNPSAYTLDAIEEQWFLVALDWN